MPISFPTDLPSPESLQEQQRYIQRRMLAHLETVAQAFAATVTPDTWGEMDAIQMDLALAATQFAEARRAQAAGEG